MLGLLPFAELLNDAYSKIVPILISPLSYTGLEIKMKIFRFVLNVIIYSVLLRSHFGLVFQELIRMFIALAIDLDGPGK